MTEATIVPPSVTTMKNLPPTQRLVKALASLVSTLVLGIAVRMTPPQYHWMLALVVGAGVIAVVVVIRHKYGGATKKT